MKKIIDWFDERIGIRELFGHIANKQIPGGASFWYVLGSALLAIFALQVGTGIFLTFYYVPTPDHAYASVKFIQNEAIFGSFVRGLHHWGASFMVVIVALHMLRVLFFGSYKKPRELVWLSGVALLLLVLGFAFTGYLLPWDQKAYWATVVGTNIAATTPVLGQFLLRITRGGQELGALTLSRFFAVHTYILPASLALFAGLHVFLIERIGASGTYNAEKAAKKTEPLFPHQIYKDSLFFVLIFGAIIALAIWLPSMLEPQADPTDSSYNPRPEWYFYSMFQLLKIFEGRLEIVGTMVLPGALFGGLMLLPFLDRDPMRDPAKRPAVMTATFFGAILVVVLTIVGAQTPQTAQAAALSPTAKLGQKVFDSKNCTVCHKLNGKGGAVGPDLTHVAGRHDAAWMDKFLTDPQAVKPGIVMPKPEITAEERKNLIEFLQTLK